jgi:hypothetical protein
VGGLKKNRTRHQTFTYAHDAAVRILNEKPVLVSIGTPERRLSVEVSGSFSAIAPISPVWWVTWDAQ